MSTFADCIVLSAFAPVLDLLRFHSLYLSLSLPRSCGGNRHTNGVAAFEAEVATLTRMADWLLTMRDSAPPHLINAIAVGVADILEAVANTPTLLQACSTTA